MHCGEKQEERPDDERMEVWLGFGGAFLVEKPRGGEDKQKGGHERIGEEQVPGRAVEAGPEPEMIETSGAFDGGPERSGEG